MEDRMSEEMKEQNIREESMGTATDSAEETKECEGESVPEDDKPGSRAEKKKIKRLEAELAETQKRLDAAVAERDAEKEKYMRMIAEYDNFRKRTQKEKENTYADAYADAVQSVLPVLDNLERAEQYNDLDAVKKGVSMTLKAAKETFEKLGITEIETKTFDPNLHNAVMHVEDETYGEGEILEVFQKGYRKGDKIIRYAMVKVAN